MTFDEFCLVNGFACKAKPVEYPEDSGEVTWVARLRNTRAQGSASVELKQPGVLCSIEAWGNTKRGALRALASVVAAQTLVAFDGQAGLGRREVKAPTRFDRK